MIATTHNILTHHHHRLTHALEETVGGRDRGTPI